MFPITDSIFPFPITEHHSLCCHTNGQLSKALRILLDLDVMNETQMRLMDNILAELQRRYT